MSYKRPAFRLKVTWNDSDLIDFSLDEKSVTSDQLQESLRKIETGITVLHEWRRFAQAVAEKKAEDAARGLLAEERFAAPKK